MKCKPGDLAVILHEVSGTTHYDGKQGFFETTNASGQIVRVVCLNADQAWILEEPADITIALAIGMQFGLTARTVILAIDDQHLQPLRGEPINQQESNEVTA